MGTNDATKGSTFLSIRGKRRSMGVDRLRSKYQAAPGDYGGGRALVRVGACNTDILIGREDLTLWSDEELRRGRKMDKNGGWQGRDPVIVAKAVHDELVRRTLAKANAMLIENLEGGLKILVELMNSDNVEPKDRIAIIKTIMDRAMGKEPIKIDLGGEAKWQVAITDSIVSMPDALVDPEKDNRDEELPDDIE
jgi:hypothetical protein